MKYLLVYFSTCVMVELDDTFSDDEASDAISLFAEALSNHDKVTVQTVETDYVETMECEVQE